MPLQWPNQILIKKKKGTSLSLVGNLSCFTWELFTAAARAVLPIPIGVCSIFMCPNNGMSASCGIFNVRTDTDACDCTPGLSALEVDSGRKIPCRTGDSKLCQYYACIFQLDTLPTELSPPQIIAESEGRVLKSKAGSVLSSGPGIPTSV